MPRSYLLSIVAGGFFLLRNLARHLPGVSQASPPVTDRAGGRPPLDPDYYRDIGRGVARDLLAAMTYPDGRPVMANETRTPEEIQQQEEA